MNLLWVHLSFNLQVEMQDTPQSLPTWVSCTKAGLCLNMMTMMMMMMMMMMTG